MGLGHESNSNRSVHFDKTQNTPAQSARTIYTRIQTNILDVHMISPTFVPKVAITPRHIHQTNSMKYFIQLLLLYLLFVPQQFCTLVIILLLFHI